MAGATSTGAHAETHRPTRRRTRRHTQAHAEMEGGGDGLSVQRSPETPGSHWQRDCPAASLGLTSTGVAPPPT